MKTNHVNEGIDNTRCDLTLADVGLDPNYRFGAVSRRGNARERKLLILRLLAHSFLLSGGGQSCPHRSSISFKISTIELSPTERSHFAFSSGQEVN